MAEILTLTTPITKPSQTTWQLQRFTMTMSGNMEFFCSGNNGESMQAVYPTPNPGGSFTGAQLVHLFNVANFSLPGADFEHQVLAFLQSDGKLGAGAISGTPA